MQTWLKLAGWGAAGLVVFWVVLKLVGFVLGFISWLISMVITLAIVVLVLVAAYYLLSRLLGGSDSSGTSRSREHERIFE